MKSRVAHFLNEKKKISPTIHLSEAREKLGNEGYSLALAENWIKPDYDTGNIVVTTNRDKLTEIEHLAELYGQPQYKVGDIVTVVEDGKSYQVAVKSVKPDGTYELSFGDDKPLQVKPTYKTDEITPSQSQQGQAGQPSVPKINPYAPTAQPAKVMGGVINRMM